MSVFAQKYREKLFAKIDGYFCKYGDSCKKIALKLAWWNIKFIFRSTSVQKKTFSDSIQHIGIYVAGGIGDITYAAKYIKALSLYLGGNVEIDVIGEEQAINSLKAIFYKQSFVHNIIRVQEATLYDLQIHLIRFPIILSYDLQRLSKQALRYVEAINKFHEKNPFLTKNGFLGRCYSQMNGRKRENQADIGNILNMLAVDFSIYTQDSDILKKLNLEQNNFITVQTGSGLHFQHIQNEMRQWPVLYYEQLVKDIKRQYPSYQVVQLGEAHQHAISNIDIDLRGKTDIQELFSLLKSSRLHISQEGGTPILRHFLKGGVSVVLFGPTDESFYGFKENINIAARNCLYSCEWLTKDWMKKCLKTRGHAECMKNIDPKDVLCHIKRRI